MSFEHPVLNLDTLFHLSFTCIVSEQFGHQVLKFPANFYTFYKILAKTLHARPPCDFKDFFLISEFSHNVFLEALSLS